MLSPMFLSAADAALFYSGSRKARSQTSRDAVLSDVLRYRRPASSCFDDQGTRTFFYVVDHRLRMGGPMAAERTLQVIYELHFISLKCCT